MHPVDGVLTNTMPLLLAVTLIPIQSHWEFHVYMAYKTAQELFGHCGTHIKVRPPPPCALTEHSELGWANGAGSTPTRPKPVLCDTLKC
jgi:sterol desaturase/sphingolipid hydroxylase (fatty acid hydroxylase superfamily)